MQFRFGTDQVSVNVDSRARLFDLVEERFRASCGFALATLNLDHLSRLAADDAEGLLFRRAYGIQDFVVADGNPVVWLSRLAGRPVELAPGSDLVLPLVELAARNGVSVAILGSTDEALKGAAAHLASEVPGARVVCRIAPPFGFDPTGPEADAMLAAVGASGAGLCLVALGAPRQEILAARGRRLAPAVGFASVGAGVDFLSGHQRRAPPWVRRLALEWLWRMLINPRRLVPRYIRCAKILPGQIGAALAERRMRRPEETHGS